MGGGTAIDEAAIREAVDVVVDRLDQCVQRCAYRNAPGESYAETPISVREARLTLQPGIERAGGYLDVQWWRNGDYKYHYREDGLEFRFDRELANRGTDVPVAHFHPPADLSRHEPSCIPRDHSVELVTLAVIANWLPAVQRGDPSVLNDRENPP